MTTMLQREGPEGVTQQRALSGAEILVEVFRQEQVEVIFGYPGGAVLPIYNALYDCGIPHILARHEQGAIHAAEGYARVTGKTGVVIATSGPGATNVVTGLADAMMDSLPLVVITGQVATSVLGTDAFQEASVVGITMPVTKHNYQVLDVAQLPHILKEAFHIANSGRPGPVLVDIPKDVAGFKTQFDYSHPVNLPGYHPASAPCRGQIEKVAKALHQARRPVILAGAGILHARAAEFLRNFVDKAQIPVAHTLLGLGGLPASHPLYLGMAGMHGSAAANTALYETDFLLNIGARFDDRVTGNLEHFAPRATVAHIDIDAAEIGKNVHTEIPVVGDARVALEMLIEEIEKYMEMEERESGASRESEVADMTNGSVTESTGEYGDGAGARYTNAVTPNADPWRAYLQTLKQQYPFWYVPNHVELKPQQVIEIVEEATSGDAIVVTDVGQHQMWAAQFYRFEKPNRLVTSGGLGTMGFGLPAAIGAQIGERDRTVVAVLGDAGFQMTMQELALMVAYNLPVKVVVVNNGSLGMVRQWQELFYEKRYSESVFGTAPDFVKLADAFGIPGYRVSSFEEAREVLSRELLHRGPVLIDCVVTPEENVYPMIAPGKGLHEMVGVTP